MILCSYPKKKKHIQDKTNRLTKEVQRVGLKCHEEKCKVMRINNRNNDPGNLNGENMKDEKLVCFGATGSKEGGGTDHSRHRIGKARQTFMQLKEI